MPGHLHLTIMVACMRTGAVRVDIEVRTGPHTEQVQVRPLGGLRTCFAHLEIYPTISRNRHLPHFFSLSLLEMCWRCRDHTCHHATKRPSVSADGSTPFSVQVQPCGGNLEAARRNATDGKSVAAAAVPLWEVERRFDTWEIYTLARTYICMCCWGFELRWCWHRTRDGWMDGWWRGNSIFLCSYPKFISIFSPRFDA